MDFLRDKSILITGGTGSFGKAAARRLVKSGLPRRVIILSRDEWKQWEMSHSEEAFRHPSIRYFLGDVRDFQRLLRAFEEVDYVIHAAALKQVPAAEYNPTEFVKTNIDGATNVINAAIDSRVQAVVALSTDKAVNPVNLYGATKLCSDKLFTAANVYVGKRKNPRLCVVRYGNVLGSRGSILPYWRRLLDEGSTQLPVTDLRMTRFWITLEEAVSFVLQSLERTSGGEIFVPKAPSMRIAEMAQVLAPHSSPQVIGIRPGEKLHETLISIEDSKHTLDCSDYYLITPEIHSGDKGYLEMLKLNNAPPAKLVPENFAYTSDTNERWLDQAALQSLLQKI